MLTIKWVRDPVAMPDPHLTNQEWKNNVLGRYDSFIRETFERCGVLLPVLISVYHPFADDWRYDLHGWLDDSQTNLRSIIEITDPILKDWPPETIKAAVAHEIGHLKILHKVGKNEDWPGREEQYSLTAFLEEARADRFAERHVGTQATIDFCRRILSQPFPKFEDPEVTKAYKVHMLKVFERVRKRSILLERHLCRE